MLTRTFSHVPGLGAHTERSLWEQGCLDWETYLADPSAFSVGSACVDTVVEAIHASVKALDYGDHQYFEKLLGSRESWRAWPEFRDKALYLDIETDGGPYGDSVTMIGLYDGAEFVALTQGEDLGEFPDRMSKSGILVTFFGLGFDVPMLKKAFPHAPFDQIHFDLCFALKRVGVRGGLKKIERQFGISRSEDTDGLNGRDAITLWQRHLRGDKDALRILTEYNREDVVNLERLAEITYSKLRDATLGQGILL